jgi:ribosomal protein S18 acetylase RimI-like enzyme
MQAINPHYDAANPALLTRPSSGAVFPCSAHACPSFPAKELPSPPDRLLKFVGDLIQHGNFHDAKTLLAECVSMSVLEKADVSTQVTKLRWRMGLPPLDASAASEWLGSRNFENKAQLNWIDMSSTLLWNVEASPSPKTASHLRSNDLQLSVVGFAMGVCMVLLLLRALACLSVCRWLVFSLDSLDMRTCLSVLRCCMSSLDSSDVRKCTLQAYVEGGSIARCDHHDDFSAHISTTPAPDTLAQPGAGEDTPEESMEHRNGQSIGDCLDRLSSDLMPDSFEDALSVAFEDDLHVASVEDKSHQQNENTLASAETPTTAASEESCSECPYDPVFHKPHRYSLAEVMFIGSVDKSNDALMQQIRALSKKAFGEDMQVRKGESVAVLLVGGEVVSYASYVLRRHVKSMSISKLAVSYSQRYRGLGRILLRHLIQVAKRRPRGELPLDVVCLSALESSLGFYKACGFHEDNTVKLCGKDDVIDGQVYMEYHLQRKRYRG